ncbi:MAG TPA: outer membrane beta-barrel protein [Bryobacteraceae bacterium]|nr:outer membrane beta-barrel protein [Bryobacteraceae bacterium]
MRKHYLSLLLIVISGPAAFAQAVSFGVTGGVPLLDRAVPNDESSPYLVGPAIEVHLRASFAIEVDAIYQRVGHSIAGEGSAGVDFVSYLDRWRGNAWEFPVLGKYYFHAHAAWQPFVAAGLAARWLSRQEDLTELSDVSGTPQPLTFHYSGWRITGGVVAAAGIRFGTGRVAWLPEFRYTRWGGSGTLTRPNEAGFLMGIRF